MKKLVFVLFILTSILGVSCSKNESTTPSSNFDPTKETQADPLKLGTGACKVDEKKDCDTTKK